MANRVASFMFILASLTGAAGCASDANDAKAVQHPTVESKSWSMEREDWTDRYSVTPWTTATFEATDMRFLPDGRALLITKGGWGGAGAGQVILISADGTETKDLLDLPVCADAERGLLGIELDPKFAANHLIYLFYTRQMSDCALTDGSAIANPVAPVYNRVSSFVFNEAGIDPSSERILVDELPGHQSSHNGGGLGFLPDGTLLVAVGEATYGRSRDIDFVGGKLLRINVTDPATSPSDNPFFDEANPGSVRSRVYASGLRNPFRFGVDPLTGMVAVGDVGTDQYEEVNLITPGGDYGFPDGEGPDDVAGATKPALWYDHSEGCLAVIGGTWVPAQWLPGTDSSGFVVADFQCGEVSIAYLKGGRAVRAALIANSIDHALSNVVLGPDGALYAIGIGPGAVPVVRIAPK